VSTAVYPAFPLYRPSEDEPTPEFSQAVERMFRVLDADRDGLLSQDELAVYMMHTTGLRLSEPDMETVLAVRAARCDAR
jgi:Ca2+-binding EF-hand superfamily protein